jgi:hypothetical protein
LQPPAQTLHKEKKDEFLQARNHAMARQLAQSTTSHQLYHITPSHLTQLKPSAHATLRHAASAHGASLL